MTDVPSITSSPFSRRIDRPTTSQLPPSWFSSWLVSRPLRSPPTIVFSYLLLSYRPLLARYLSRSSIHPGKTTYRDRTFPLRALTMTTLFPDPFGVHLLKRRLFSRVGDVMPPNFRKGSSFPLASLIRIRIRAYADLRNPLRGFLVRKPRFWLRVREVASSNVSFCRWSLNRVNRTRKTE